MGNDRLNKIPALHWLWLAFSVGILLRLLWPSDMEYFSDQQSIFANAMRPFWDSQKTWIENGLGIFSSVGILSPGLTYWIFQIPVKIFGLSTPPELALVVRSTNIIAMGAFLFFALKIVEKNQRAIWVWAWLMMLVNPFSVLFQRRIWPPCMLYLFLAFFLIGWWRREKRWGSFLFGFTGILMCQLHMLGAAFFAAYLLWAWMGRREKSYLRWLPFLLGIFLGILPMLPWIVYFLEQVRDGTPMGDRVAGVAYQLRFWRYWITQPFGLLLSYFLEPGGYFREFLAFPKIGGRSTYLMAALHAVLGFSLVVITGASLRSAFLSVKNKTVARDFWGRGSETNRSVHAALWGYGIAATAKTFYLFRHYLIISEPLQFAWLARSALQLPEKWSRRLLLALWFAQLGVSAGLLLYLHQNDGAPGAEYGHSYRKQVEIGVWTSDNNLDYHRDHFVPKRSHPPEELYRK